MRSWRLLSIVALLALFPLTLFGQAQTTGSVTGTVLDDQGDPVTNAEITLSGPAIQGERTTRTNSAGQYTARLLPPGEYTAVIAAPGYQTGVIRFRVAVGETMRTVGGATPPTVSVARRYQMDTMAATLICCEECPSAHHSIR